MPRMRREGLLGLFLFGAAALVACGDHPGGTVGAACSDVGSADECEPGEVCDEIDGGEAYCLLRCGDHSDCDPNERCNGVSKDSGKACHPQDADDDDDPDDDEGGIDFDDDDGRKGRR